MGFESVTAGADGRPWDQQAPDYTRIFPRPLNLLFLLEKGNPGVLYFPTQVNKKGNGQPGYRAAAPSRRTL